MEWQLLSLDCSRHSVLSRLRVGEPLKATTNPDLTLTSPKGVSGESVAENTFTLHHQEFWRLWLYSRICFFFFFSQIPQSKMCSLQCDSYTYIHINKTFHKVLQALQLAVAHLF